MDDFGLSTSRILERVSSGFDETLMDCCRRWNFHLRYHDLHALAQNNRHTEFLVNICDCQAKETPVVLILKGLAHYRMDREI